MLFRLVSSRVLPASVAFEPLTLRQLSRRLACLALNKERADLTSSLPDILVFVQVLNQVLVVEMAPPVKLLHREFITTIYFARHFSSDEQFSFLEPYLRGLLPILVSELVNVIDKRYIPIPIPEIVRREVPLTEEEEKVLYKSWEEQGLI
ncbi:hypothetical protein PSACC_02236 [Paramicrosporidium saccamoebae]|uniref:Uncharacterized protein n=1 Tax=Paramicrosporidium saccamoebae TaxID=1246581 RepID=A0A2H9TJJ8_9FUNG|nr:hypothetical protein PSACC_02236 [Paramicrosporidium saccamoebae]